MTFITPHEWNRWTDNFVVEYGFIICSFIPYSESPWSFLWCLLALLLWETVSVVLLLSFISLMISCGFIVFHFSSLFSRQRLQLHELLSQASFLPLFLLTAFPAFIVVFCIFEKSMRCMCCMWHPHTLCFIFCSFLTLPPVTKTSPLLSEQVLLLLPYFRSYSDDQSVGVQIPWTPALDHRGKDDSNNCLLLRSCCLCFAQGVRLTAKAKMSSL